VLSEWELRDLAGTQSELSCLLFVAVYRFETRILLSIPERFLFAGLAKRHHGWIAPAGNVQHAAPARVTIDTLTHACVDQEQEPVPLKKVVLAAVLSVRKLYCAWLMALNDVVDSERFHIAGEHRLRIGRKAAKIEPG